MQQKRELEKYEARFARIEQKVSALAERVSEEDAFFSGGESIRHDLLVAFPPYVAAVDYRPELPGDERGFVLTEPSTRRVRGQERIYAPGDAGDFPVKQAFLAFLQADAAAEDIVRMYGRIVRERTSY